jgi:serine/threonine protein kinase
MAPELEHGRLANVGPRTDVYSMGKLLYFMLTRGVSFSREEHRSREYNLERRAFDPRAKLFESLLNKSITKHPHERFKDAAQMYAAFMLIVEAYRTHPLTQILARSVSLDIAANAPENELMGLPGSQLSALLDYIASSVVTVPQALLSAAASRLDDPDVFRSICRCLTAREQELDPKRVGDLAATLVISKPKDVSILMTVGIEGERHIMDIATRNSDLTVLNALMSKPQFGLGSFPKVVERLGKQVHLLSPEARRNFVVSTYRLPWTDKENFLIDYVDTCKDSLEFEAAIAGLCHCGTGAALAKVEEFKEKPLTEEQLGAFLRGIVWRMAISV